MRKSASIVLGLVQAVSAAAVAGGCGSKSNAQTWQTCVDRTNTVVDERHCEDDQQRTVGHPGYTPYYRYYYYRASSAPVVGYPVPEGGGFARPSGAVTHPTSVTRGGFGGTAAGQASGGES